MILTLTPYETTIHKAQARNDWRGWAIEERIIAYCELYEIYEPVTVRYADGTLAFAITALQRRKETP